MACELVSNAVILAKVRGHPWWPAKIINKDSKGNFNVYFFGSRETAKVKLEHIKSYIGNEEKTPKGKDLLKAYKEIEEEIARQDKEYEKKGKKSIKPSNSKKGKVRFDLTKNVTYIRGDTPPREKTASDADLSIISISSDDSMERGLNLLTITHDPVISLPVMTKEELEQALKPKK